MHRMHDNVNSMAPNTSALANGLTVLQMLVDEPGPLSASEIARRMGMHQSSISRILATLAEAGFAQKVGAQAFSPDYGVLSLSVASLNKYSIAQLPRTALERAAADYPGHSFALSVLWRGRIIYFLRTCQGQETRVFDADGRWPLHLSSPGLCLLLSLPADEALELLDGSRRRLGWDRPGPAAPPSPEEALFQVRAGVSHECLVLDDWQAVGRRSSAIALNLAGYPPVALSMAGTTDLMSIPDVRLALHTVRREVESAMTTNTASQSATK